MPFGRGVPRLAKILENWFSRNMEVVAMSGHHNMTSGLDNRYWDYANEASELVKYRAENHDDRWLSFGDLESGKRLIVPNSQVVRCYEEGNVADVNVLFVPEILIPGKNVDSVVQKAQQAGGLVLLPRIGRNGGVSVRKAASLIEQGLAHGVEVMAEDGHVKDNKTVHNFLSSAEMHERIRSHFVPVSGAHHYTLAGTACALFPDGLVEDFSVEGLKQNLAEGNYDTIYGSISKWDRFKTRDIYLLKGFAGHYLAGGIRRIENLKVFFGGKRGQ